jgi:hypothetical protein
MRTLGTRPGLARRATILRYNNDGTCMVGLDEVGLQGDAQTFNIPLSPAWSGPSGEFMGGFPARGTSVIICQSQGGQWFIQGHIPSRTTFTTNNQFDAFKEGRALIQTNGKRIIVDPTDGIEVGDKKVKWKADPTASILSSTYDSNWNFSQSSRRIEGPIRRDLSENSNRGIVGSSLTSHISEKSLFTIGLDPTAKTAISTASDRVRNPPLSEVREVVYEFSPSFKIGSDVDESSKLNGEIIEESDVKQNNRPNAWNLTANYPNHLIEIIKGTAVDVEGNVLDLNRSALPIGKLKETSLLNNSNKSAAFNEIKALHRKAIAYHFEINTKKQGIINQDGSQTVADPPDVNDVSDYARNRSHFFLDVDKEGQFKINIPASSETGNIPLLTRYENYSTLLAAIDDSVGVNDLVRNENLQDIFQQNFAGKVSIKLKSSVADLDGYSSPIDRLTNKPIYYGTTYHDITKSLIVFQKGSDNPVYYDPDHPLNKVAKLDHVVSDTIIVSGVDANAGGRSGLINSDGAMNINIGANTIDRQSLWLDCAGGVVSQIGRDRQGISYAATLDGDMFVQIGGTGIGNTFDKRFSDENDASRAGVLDIRVLKGDSLMSTIRIDEGGVTVTTAGRMNFRALQDIYFESNAQIHFNAERCVFYSKTNTPRLVERKKINI